MVISVNCRLDCVNQGGQHHRILPGCRESACRLPALWVQGVAPGRDRPSDDDQVVDLDGANVSIDLFSGWSPSRD